MSSSIKAEFEDRWWQFCDSTTEEEVDTFYRSLVTVGEMVEASFGPEIAASTMAALEQVIARTSLERPLTTLQLPDPAPTNWREEWEGKNASTEFFSVPMIRARDLSAFAGYGILGSWPRNRGDDPIPGTETNLTDVPRYIEETIAMLEKFMSLFGHGAPTWAFKDIEKMILAARARLKIDHDEPMTVHELAAVTGVETKRLQNAMYAKSEQAPIANADGLISPASAERWLAARNYRRSIWREFIAQRCWEGSDHEETVDAVADVVETDEFVFIPEAADGTVFGPLSCGRGSNGSNRYTVGEKGNEQIFDSYDEALAALISMITPRWRRPNSNGNFGIVRAERWRRVSRSELAKL